MEENPTAPMPFMSASIDQISVALSAFQGSIEQPKLEKEVKVKTKSGSSYSFKYADLSAVVKAATPALKANGLAVCQLVNSGKLVTILSHKSGQWFKSELLLPNQTSDYQGYGSAITYLKRYSYCAILGIVADTDDDANMACGNQADVKDRNQKMYSGAQLNEALAEVAAATSHEQVNDVWARWSALAPALCKKGSEFYNACAQKVETFRSAN